MSSGLRPCCGHQRLTQEGTATGHAGALGTEFAAPGAPAGQALAWPSGSRAPMWSPSWSSHNRPLQAWRSKGCLGRSVPDGLLLHHTSSPSARAWTASGLGVVGGAGAGQVPLSLVSPARCRHFKPESWDLLRKAAQGVSSFVFWGEGWRENFQEWL